MAAIRQAMTRALLKQIRGGTALAAPPPPPRRPAFSSGKTFFPQAASQGYGTRAGFHSAQMAAERRQAELIKATDEVMRNLQKERAKADKIMLGLLSMPFVATAGYEVMRNLEKERAKTNKDGVMNNSV